MKTRSEYSLIEKNTFAVAAKCPQYYAPESIDELKQIFTPELGEFYLLGEGSNTLFVEQRTPVIVQPKFTGIKVVEQGDDVFVSVGCAENWHELVQFCLEHGYHGLENLALIPGSVGAAPVQNIGAYGTELADVLDSVTWYDCQRGCVTTLSNAQCQFGYRDSIFKRALFGKGIIIEVKLKLSRIWQANISYKGLDLLPVDATAEQVFNKVIELRQSKLPAPNELPNAGSFFKNPVITAEQFHSLQQDYPSMPNYPQSSGKVKLAAGWLIEQCGLKGHRQNGVGVHDKQALVLVNYTSNQGGNIVELAQLVQQKVKEKFAIDIEPEVRLLAANGLVSLKLEDNE